MSEIVERLRFTARVRQTSRPDDDPITVECLEAAAEIAKLRAEVAWHEKVQTSQAATIERLTKALEAADKMRDGIRAAGVKRMPELYAAVMAFDATRAALEQETGR